MILQKPWVEVNYMRLLCFWRFFVIGQHCQHRDAKQEQCSSHTCERGLHHVIVSTYSTVQIILSPCWVTVWLDPQSYNYIFRNMTWVNSHNLHFTSTTADDFWRDSHAAVNNGSSGSALHQSTWGGIMWKNRRYYSLVISYFIYYALFSCSEVS